MVGLMVIYGHPKDPQAFDRYDDDVQLPSAKKIKGFPCWTVGKISGAPDGKPAPYDCFADLFAESRPAVERILAAPEGRAAVQDVPNFATGGVTFLYSDVEQLV
jgi:uncharacterized protein (TIGR02118 family)